MLCEFASGARGSFEASRAIVGPESQMAFDVHGTAGAPAGTSRRSTSCGSTARPRTAARATPTVLGGERFPPHGAFVPGSANGIGFEDLVTIEDAEFCAAVAEEPPVRARASTPRSPGCRCRRRCCARAQSGRWEDVVSLRED